MRWLLDRRLLFFGGKGGVGKTTCSSAFALAASRSGRHVLLVSTDPAHSTSDIFEQPLGSDARVIEPGLSAIEIDPARESARYVGRIKRDLEQMFTPEVVRQATRQIDLAASSPGLADVALFDRIVDLIVERDPRYDLIVFDTAPTGHTVQLLRLPDVMQTWIRALIKHRRALLEIDRAVDDSTRVSGSQPDPVLAALERRQERLKVLRACLFDRGTAFVLVTVPERLAIEETVRADSQLRDTGLDIAGLIINRVLPAGLEGAFFRSRQAQEGRHLDEIDRRFGGLPRTIVRLLPSDVSGLDALALISRQLQGEDARDVSLKPVTHTKR
jgi:arsenite-transporting ATPase